MEVVFDKVGFEVFKAVLSLLQDFLDEATFRFDGEGLRFRGMDASRVAMIDFVLSKSGFAKYECLDSKEVCVRVHDLLRFLGRVKKDEEVALKIEDNFLYLGVSGKYSRKFKLPLLEPIMDVPDVPKIEYKIKCTVPLDLLHSVLEDAHAIMGGYIKISADANGLTFHSSNGIIDASAILERDRLISLEANEESRAMYNLEFIRSTVKSMNNVFEYAVLMFASDMPLKLTFQRDIAQVDFYLAPRIET